MYYTVMQCVRVVVLWWRPRCWGWMWFFCSVSVSAARLGFFSFHWGEFFIWNECDIFIISRGLTRAPWDFTPLNCVSLDVVVVVVRIITCTILQIWRFRLWSWVRSPSPNMVRLIFCADLAFMVTGIFLFKASGAHHEAKLIISWHSVKDLHLKYWQVYHHVDNLQRQVWTIL